MTDKSPVSVKFDGTPIAIALLIIFFWSGSDGMSLWSALKWHFGTTCAKTEVAKP